MKQTNKHANRVRVYDRLNQALNDMYHNATPDYPYDLMEEYDKLHEREGAAMDCFYDMASFELDYLNEGGAYGLKPYDLHEHNLDKPKAEKRRLRRKYRRDMAQAPEFRIAEYGNLCTYGRGGRTLAPENLVTMRGGGSFSLRQCECAEDLPYSEAVEMLEIVEAFNKYVESWNSRENLAAIFKELNAEKRAEIESEISDTRKEVIALVQDMKRKRTDIDTASPVCEVLRSHLAQTLASLRHMQSTLRPV